MTSACPAPPYPTTPGHRCPPSPGRTDPSLQVVGVEDRSQPLGSSGRRTDPSLRVLGASSLPCRLSFWTTGCSALTRPGDRGAGCAGGGWLTCLGSRAWPPRPPWANGSPPARPRLLQQEHHTWTAYALDPLSALHCHRPTWKIKKRNTAPALGERSPGLSARRHAEHRCV